MTITNLFISQIFERIRALYGVQFLRLEAFYKITNPYIKGFVFYQILENV